MSRSPDDPAFSKPNLNENWSSVSKVIREMRKWYGTKGYQITGVGKMHGDVLELGYGLGERESGRVRIDLRDNFKMTFTNANKEYPKDEKYNYNIASITTISQSDIKKALQCTDLNADEKSKAIMIVLCAETARSDVVAAYVRRECEGVDIDKANGGHFQTVIRLCNLYSATVKKRSADRNDGEGERVEDAPAAAVAEAAAPPLTKKQAQQAEKNAKKEKVAAEKAENMNKGKGDKEKIENNAAIGVAPHEGWRPLQEGHYRSYLKAQQGESYGNDVKNLNKLIDAIPANIRALPVLPE